jgi:hypothetical protein
LTNGKTFAIILFYTLTNGAAMNITEINTAIMTGNFTSDQLVSIGDAIRFAREKMTRQVARSLSPGATVQFRSNKNGVTYKGTLESIKIKNAIVATPTGRYRVPMNMLQLA